MRWYPARRAFVSAQNNQEGGRRQPPIVSCDAKDAAYTVAALMSGDDSPFRTALVVGANTKAFTKTLARFQPALKLKQEIISSEAPDAAVKLPYPDRSFDLIIALDVIAGLPPDMRSLFFRDLVRVASRTAICAAPLGTDLHLLIIRSLINFYRERFHTVHSELAKHVEYGLPTPQEAFSWIRHGEDADIFYAGDIIAYQHAAERIIRQAEQGWLRALLWWLKTHNSISRDPSLNEPETVPIRRHRRFFLYLRRT